MTQERPLLPADGWPMLRNNLLAVGVGAVCFFTGAVGNFGPLIVAGLLLGVGAIVSLVGHFTVAPNQACVVTFFGPYVGTVREAGFYWANPFYSKRKLSLRARNFEGAKLKVNDKQGNPIEIAAVVVWHVSNTAEAVFDVEDYEQYVQVQSETALRHLANSYAYDHGEEHEVTLRSGVDEVSSALKQELTERLARAGVVIDETRLTHLAYAPEIAGVMLRRQQAEAIIAARQKIVHGAVSMVEMALRELGEKAIVDFDAPGKASLVSNLLIVLCSESEARPVISTKSGD